MEAGGASAAQMFWNISTRYGRSSSPSPRSYTSPRHGRARSPSPSLQASYHRERRSSQRKSLDSSLLAGYGVSGVSHGHSRPRSPDSRAYMVRSPSADRRLLSRGRGDRAKEVLAEARVIPRTKFEQGSRLAAEMLVCETITTTKPNSHTLMGWRDAVTTNQSYAASRRSRSSSNAARALRPNSPGFVRSSSTSRRSPFTSRSGSINTRDAVPRRSASPSLDASQGPQSRYSTVSTVEALQTAYRSFHTSSTVPAGLSSGVQTRGGGSTTGERSRSPRQSFLSPRRFRPVSPTVSSSSANTIHRSARTISPPSWGEHSHSRTAKQRIERARQQWEKMAQRPARSPERSPTNARWSPVAQQETGHTAVAAVEHARVQGWVRDVENALRAEAVQGARRQDSAIMATKGDHMMEHTIRRAAQEYQLELEKERRVQRSRSPREQEYSESLLWDHGEFAQIERSQQGIAETLANLKFSRRKR